MNEETVLTAYRTAIGRDVPLEDTPYGRGIDLIAARTPGWANAIRAVYEERLLPQIRRVIALGDAADKRRAAFNDEASAANAEIDAAQTRRRATCDEAVRADREKLAETDEELRHIRRTNAVRASRNGRLRSPDRLDEGVVIPAHQRSFEELATEIRVPYDERDADPLVPERAMTLGMWVVGSVTGIAFGVVSGKIAPENIWRNPLTLALMAALGIVIVMFAKWAVRSLAVKSSALYWAGQPLVHWGSWTAIAAAVWAGSIGIEALIQAWGAWAFLSSRAQLLGQLDGSGSGSDSPSIVLLFIAGLFISGSLLTAAALSGERAGRHASVSNRLEAMQAAESREHEAALRSDPAVQDTLAGLAQEAELLSFKNLLEGRINDAVALAESENAADEAKRTALMDVYYPADLEALQQAVSDLYGTDAEFRGMFERALQETDLHPKSAP